MTDPEDASPAGRRLKVLIWVAHHLEASPMVESYLAEVTGVFDGHDVQVAVGRDAYRGRMHGVQVLVCWGFHPDVLTEADSLEWIQFSSAGINHAMTPELQNSPIRLTTQVGLHAVTMAEHALGMMLAWSRRLNLAIRDQAQKQWRREPASSEIFEFEGTTVGIIGTGNIGATLGRKCRALGARVIATRSERAPEDAADEWVDKSDLDPLLKTSDWVCICTPQTPRTEGLLKEREFSLMKPSAVLVNIARGVIVDQDALVGALQEKRIAGACLDVTSPEPLPEDSPLWAMENVILTPHVGGATPLYGLKGARIVRRNLEAFLAGERMPTEYDRLKGY